MDHQINPISTVSSSSSSASSASQPSSSSSSSSNIDQPFYEVKLLREEDAKSTKQPYRGKIYGSSKEFREEEKKRINNKSETMKPITSPSSISANSSSSSSTKRYQNSPFGLKNHFVAMPAERENEDSYIQEREPGQHQQDDGCLTSSDPESGGDHSGWPGYVTSKSKSSKTAMNPSRTKENRHQKHHPRASFKTNTSSIHMITRQPRGTVQCAMMSDAGLDADKCNAKQQQQQQAASQFGKSTASETSTNPAPLPIGKGVEQTDLLVRFSSFMYATFLVILGCIFHISELRQKSRNSSDHIYTIIVAFVGIIWLLFLQVDLLRYKRFASRYILIESIFNDNQSVKRKSQGARSTSSSAASLVNDRVSLNTEVLFKKTAYKMYRQQEAMNRHGNNKLRRLPNHHKSATKHMGADLGGLSDFSGTSSIFDLSNNDESTSNIGLTKLGDTNSGVEPAYKFLHGKMGANFYLKCGMAAFCFGHVIHEGLRFGQQLYFFGTGNVHCRDSAALVAHLITPLYSFYQLFMMFKYSNLVINRHKTLAKFGLMHIIGTSVTFWFRTIMEEAFEDFVHKMDYFKANNKFGSKEVVELLTDQQNTSNSHNSNSILTLMSSPISDTITPQLVRHLPDSYACAQNTLLTTKSMNALPYLYPFTIEYNLLLAATFLSLYFNIGKVGHKGIGSSGCRPILDCGMVYPSYHLDKPTSIISHNDIGGGGGGVGSPSTIKTSHDGHEKEVGEYKSNFVVNADCHSANKGLFCGFFVLLVTLVTIVIFFVTINKPSHVQLGIKINLIQEASLTILILIVTLAGLKQINKLNKNPYLRDKVTTDDVLMLIPLPFFFIHSLLSIRAETATMISGSNYLHSSSLLFNNQLTSTHKLQGNDILATVATGLIGNTNGTLGLLTDDFISDFGDNNNVESDNIRNNNIDSNSTDHDGNINSGNSNNNNNINNLANRSSFSSRTTHSDTNRDIVSHRIIGNITTSNNRNVDISNNGNSNNSNLVVVLGIGGSGGGGGVGRGSSSRSSSVGGGVGGSRIVGNSSSGNIRVGNSNYMNSNYRFSQIDHSKFTVALNIFVMIEVIVQTIFIIDGMRRCSESRYLRFKKPGRELITFAILLNITYWIVATFETKSVEQHKTEIEYYGPLPYMFISHTTLPVKLFYRYHSSVCLTEIWNRAYKPPKKP